MSEASRAVTFRVGPDLYAADIDRVERVLRYTPAHAVPSLPGWIDGVMDHDGRVIPVIDLRKRFGCEETAVRAGTRVLVLKVGEECMGVVVDAVLDVRPMPDESLTPPPALFRGLAGGYLRGMWRRDAAELVVVLDVDRLLTARGPLSVIESTDG